MSDPIDREQALSAFDTDDNKLVIRGSENADAVEQYLKKVMGKIENLPSAQPEKHTEERAETHGVCLDTISRQAAIEAIRRLPNAGIRWFVSAEAVFDALLNLPSAQPERTPMQELLDVTADRDYWKAQCHSYEMTINRLTESAQPEIIRCKDCKYGVVDDPEIPTLLFCEDSGQDWNDENHYCGYAERREEK